MIQHLSRIIILCSAYMSLIMRARYKILFLIMSLGIPTIFIYFLHSTNEEYIFNVLTIDISILCSAENKIIALSFAIILALINLYSSINLYYKEVVFGSLYAAFSILCVLANDFLTMILSIELMMIFSTILIYYGGKKQSIYSSKRYFITHLVSGNFIIIGICAIIVHTGSIKLINLSHLLDNSDMHKYLVLMLIGMIVNIAAFPFSGWMTDYYPQSSSSGFMYLISFTTKISIILLAKIFSGYENIKYLAYIVIIYSTIKSLLEDNILSLLCHLSLIQMGFLLLTISYGASFSFAFSLYLAIHIAYKGLFSMIAAILEDYFNITTMSNIFVNKILLLPFIIAYCAMLSLPFSNNFFAKYQMISALHNNEIVTIIAKIIPGILVIALPWKILIVKDTKEYSPKVRSKNYKFSLYLIYIFSIILLYISYVDLNYFSHKIDNIYYHMLILVISCVISYFISIKRRHYKTVNLIDFFEPVLMLLSQKSTLPSEEQDIESTNYYYIKEKIFYWYNQKTVIYIAFAAISFMIFWNNF